MRARKRGARQADRRSDVVGELAVSRGRGSQGRHGPLPCHHPLGTPAPSGWRRNCSTPCCRRPSCRRLSAAAPLQALPREVVALKHRLPSFGAGRSSCFSPPEHSGHAILLHGFPSFAVVLPWVLRADADLCMMWAVQPYAATICLSKIGQRDSSSLRRVRPIAVARHLWLHPNSENSHVARRCPTEPTTILRARPNLP